MFLEVSCPQCGTTLKLFIDLSEGPPSTVGTECDCGMVPVFELVWWYEFKLGSFLYNEREPKRFRAKRYEVPPAGCEVRRCVDCDTLFLAYFRYDRWCTGCEISF